MKDVIQIGRKKLPCRPQRITKRFEEKLVQESPVGIHYYFISI